jgi:hypothetical protein
MGLEQIAVPRPELRQLITVTAPACLPALAHALAASHSGCYQPHLTWP